jgi:hypothetical protein
MWSTAIPFPCEIIYVLNGVTIRKRSSKRSSKRSRRPSSKKRLLTKACRLAKGAGKAVSTWDEHTTAGEHATSGHTAAEMHATTGHTAAEMHAATGHATAEMHATSGHTAAGVLRQGWRRNGNCRSKHGRGEAAEEFAFDDADPP